MKNITDVISDSKKKEFNIEIEIQLENSKMKSQLVVNETTSSFAKEQAERILAENNIMKFEITSIEEVEEEEEEVEVEVEVKVNGEEVDEEDEDEDEADA